MPNRKLYWITIVDWRCTASEIRREKNAGKLLAPHPRRLKSSALSSKRFGGDIKIMSFKIEHRRIGMVGSSHHTIKACIESSVNTENRCVKVVTIDIEITRPVNTHVSPLEPWTVKDVFLNNVQSLSSRWARLAQCQNETGYERQRR